MGGHNEHEGVHLCEPGGSSRWGKRWGIAAAAIAVFTVALLVEAPESRAQDAVAGEKVFAICRACHQVGPAAKNAVGPVLNGLFGRFSGSVEGYAYSSANKSAHLTWDEITFVEYIKNPRTKVPGTKMIYAGMKDEQKIKDLIAYLHQFDGAPVTLIKD